jgi:hypothetical protein
MSNLAFGHFCMYKLIILRVFEPVQTLVYTPKFQCHTPFPNQTSIVNIYRVIYTIRLQFRGANETSKVAEPIAKSPILHLLILMIPITSVFRIPKSTFHVSVSTYITYKFSLCMRLNVNMYMHSRRFYVCIFCIFQNKDASETIKFT